MNPLYAAPPQAHHATYPTAYLSLWEAPANDYTFFLSSLNAASTDTQKRAEYPSKKTQYPDPNLRDASMPELYLWYALLDRVMDGKFGVCQSLYRSQSPSLASTTL